MTTEGDRNKQWAGIIADAIEVVLDDYRHERESVLGFVDLVAARDPALYDPKSVTEASLAAAWNYADSFGDAAWHGFKDLDGMPWGEATRLLADTGRRLRAGQPIEDARVVRYARYGGRPR